MKELTVKANDGLELSCALYECDEPKAIIQVIHGATEHKGRYDNFCEFLNNLGYCVIASDNRGHGKSVDSKYFLGHFDSCEQIVQDQYEITKYVRSLHPDAPLYLFGHSFGSLLARMYIQQHDAEVEKLVLTGTVFPISLAKAGTAFCNIAVKLYGENSTKGLICKMINTGSDTWVCGNPYTLVEYRKDPLVQGCKYTTSAIREIANSTAHIRKIKDYKCQNKELCIYTANGEKDRFRGGNYGLAKTIKFLNKAGYIHVSATTYPGMKHEVINELDKASVYADIARFYNAKVK